MKEKWNAIVSGSVFILLMFGAMFTEAKERLTTDSLLRRVTYQTWSFPQEKIYISTDRDAYVSGDTIRFRAFLVDASTHMKPKLESKYIYVELVNSFGEKTERIKVMKKDNVYAGILPLDAEMPEGTYTLSAYTQFMLNTGNDYFFRKPIPVFNQLSSRYNFDIKTENGVLKACLSERGSERPVKVENISINGPGEEYFASGIRKRSEYSMKISDKMKDAGHVIVRFDKYEKFVSIPLDSTKFSITFHAEGGHLIPDIRNRLAFKAVKTDGLSHEIVGRLIDDYGNEICEFKSDHKGMGVIEFIPASDKKYSAIIDSRTFSIPDTENDIHSISVSPVGTDSISINILPAPSQPLYLIAHTGGIVSFVSEISEKVVRLDRKKLGSGIVQLLLTNDSGDIMSSRMIFNHSGYIYGYDTDSLPDGDYTVKASLNAKPDTTHSIVSSLLLQSELKGVIENPDYYFRQRDSITDSHLDLVMLTHGWERYDLNSALHNNYAKPQHPMEIGGEISGIVKSRWKGKPLKNAVVMLISPQLNFADQTITDANGRFVFKGLDWPDHTAFTIQVLGKNGNNEHNFSIDEEDFVYISPIPEMRELNEMYSMDNYDYLTAGTVMLEELVVTAPMGSEQARREMLASLGVKSFNSKEMEERHITSYEEVFKKNPRSQNCKRKCGQFILKSIRIQLGSSRNSSGVLG